jgi:hypothetical protein
VKAKHEIGDILQRYYSNIDVTKYSVHQQKTLRALRDCRTAALGGHVDSCDECGIVKISYNSCRNRHCPKCQGIEKEMWMIAREEELLPVTYFHVVFTIPHELNDLCRYAPQAMYDILFESAWKTLSQFGYDKRWLGAQIGTTMILHTWGQNLSLHPHVHCIVPSGGLASAQPSPKRKEHFVWQHPKKGNEKFLFPVSAMKSVYRALFMKALHEKIRLKTIDLPPDFVTSKTSYTSWKNALFQKEWVIYAKRPFGGPQQVIEYLGRYTHKVAISNHRIQSIDNEIVTFEYKDYKDGGSKKTMALKVNEFIRRFAQHILPSGFRRIRHFGFLSNASKSKSLAAARKSLGLKAQERSDRATRKALARERLLGQNPDQCRCCKKGTMLRVAILPPSRAPPTSETLLQHAVWC